MSNESTRILVVDDEEIVRESLGGWLEKDGYFVAKAPDGASALGMLEAEPWSILIVDLKMPGLDGMQVLERAKKRTPDLAVVMMTAYATVDTAVGAMKLGAYDYLVKPFDPEELSLMMQKIVAQQALLRENAVLRQALKQEYRFRDLVSKSPAMQAIFDLARTAARSNSTILVLGESGSGKEVLARAVHQESPRAQGPFVAVSCASLTESLLESELFGHERGAFTGAFARRKGKFEAADGGTLFLDEVGDVSSKLQLDLLRVLEDRRFHRLGGNAPVEVDVRIVAATNRDLHKAVQEGRFREDLYYRLNVIPISIPPLRQRREDVPLLVEEFLARLSRRSGLRPKRVSAEAMEVLQAYSWPGNVREVRNVVERLMIMVTDDEIRPEHVQLQAAAELPARDGQLTTLKEARERFERAYVEQVVQHCHGNMSQAARVLGLERSHFYRKLRALGLLPIDRPPATR